MFDAIADRRIKAVWIMSTNPLVSLPDADRVRRALDACELVVVSDCMRHTDTTRHAHVLLPALTWGEKDGTVTNSERRISRQRSFLALPGEVRPDWRIICDVASRMGFAQAFAYRSPAEIFAEHAALSAFENDGQRDFDIGAVACIDSAAFDTMAPFQWPRTAPDAPTESRFFSRGGFYTPDRKGPVTYIDMEGPIVVRSRRSSAVWMRSSTVSTSARWGLRAALRPATSDGHGSIRSRR
jgi:assimilatory nitrate reductase catalytic subunit